MVTTEGNIRLVRIEDEMRSSYLDYAMSVIVARALPDARDGLKPVQRRILYAMQELNLRPNSPYKKCARIVGEVLGKYHPHGDAPVYDALVRLAQEFSMRYTLVDGQGNFGSVDNDPPAAMRYTEARLAGIAEEMLVDIERDTVDFTPNFDGSLNEPSILPARLPNLLANGTSGIAVGMATNIPPHNLSELCDGISFLLDTPDGTIDQLAEFIKGPDFPTGAIIMGTEGIKAAFQTGRGRVVMQARARVEELKGGRSQIIISELPYQLNKAALVEKIADLVKNKRIDGISEVRDESDREGLRVVLDLKRDSYPEQVLNNLYKLTAMRSAFNINMLALVDGQPRVLNLKQALKHYIEFRQQVIERRTRFELRKARDRAHILEGLIKALDNLDAIITLIRASADAEAARNGLMTQFALTQIQAQAILDMQLRRLAALERQKILDEYDELKRTIEYLESLLADPAKILAVIKEETIELKRKFGDTRRTEISLEEAREFSQEELVPSQDVVVTLSQRGYIKRLPVETYRLQRRGGKGVTGMVTREEDVVQDLLIANTHDLLLFFTNKGRVTPLKCWELPSDVTRTAKGLPIVNLIPLEDKERISAVLAIKAFEEGRFLVFATRMGEVKKTALEEFSNLRTKGVITMDLEKDDELVSVVQSSDQDDVLMVTEGGQALRFAVSQLRSASRLSGGVRGMRLNDGDLIVAMDVAAPDKFMLVLSKRGYGKLTRVTQYPTHNRGGKGILTFKTTYKTGKLAVAKVVSQDQEIIIASAKGIVFRTAAKQISVRGRITMGVSVMKPGPEDEVASVACFGGEEEEPPESPAPPPAPKGRGKPPGGKSAAPEAGDPEEASEAEDSSEADEADETAEEEAPEDREEQEEPPAPPPSPRGHAKPAAPPRQLPLPLKRPRQKKSSGS